MKLLKKGLLLLLAFCMCVGSVGCMTRVPEATAPETTVPKVTAPKVTLPEATLPEVTAPTVNPLKEAYKDDPAGFVKFSRSTEPREWYVPVSELLEYESQYPDCNGTWFRDQLSGEDLIIYNGFLYALENRFTHFLVYVEDSDKDFSYIREYLSLDSPFLEQNYTHYEYIWKQPINYVGKSISVSMEQFTQKCWDMKMEALETCRQIVQNIPAEYQTQQEKMEYLYDYVCDHVEYVDYESTADESYFYDAVCKGQTLCDGYSNMLSLLFRMIGVECCEVIGRDEEKLSGHTWVAAKLEGVFYNFDPTFEDTSEIPSDQRKFFGFSDNLAGATFLEHEQLRPKCTDTSRDFVYADITVRSFTDWDEVKRIAALAEEKLEAGEQTILVGVNKPLDSGMYDVFFDRYSVYSKSSKEIALVGWQMRNGALIEISLTPIHDKTLPEPIRRPLGGIG